MIVTDEMKEAGADILWDVLGFQYMPDDVDRRELAESIFAAMMAAAQQTIPCE